MSSKRATRLRQRPLRLLSVLVALLEAGKWAIDKVFSSVSSEHSVYLPTGHGMIPVE